jgi:hypothetical protein
VLIETTNSVGAERSKTVIPHSFEVPAGTEALHLRFDYGPRKCGAHEAARAAIAAAIDRHVGTFPEAMQPELREILRERMLNRGVANLLNVVLIDPTGRWRGRWDRNPASRDGALVLSAEGASDGFLPGAIIPGRWTATVEIHCVLGDPVTYTLSVGAGASLAPREPIEGRASSGLRLRRRWGEAQDRWRMGELHSHSVHSDGAHRVEELLGRADALGIDFLALTDHNATSGLDEVDRPPLTILWGCELTTFFGHHPVYGIDSPPPWHVGDQNANFSDLFSGIRKSGGVVSVAHPFKIGDPICTGCRAGPFDPASVDMMEVWYRSWSDPEHDDRAALAMWDRFWDQGHRVTGVAARDWHGPAQESPFPGVEPFTAVRSDSDDAAEILAGLKAGRVVMTGGPMIELDRAQAGLTIKTYATEPGSELRLVRNGKTVERFETNADLDLTRTANEGRWRAELWQDDLPRAITNHVLI